MWIDYAGGGRWTDILVPFTVSDRAQCSAKCPLLSSLESQLKLIMVVVTQLSQRPEWSSHMLYFCIAKRLAHSGLWDNNPCGECNGHHIGIAMLGGRGFGIKGAIPSGPKMWFQYRSPPPRMSDMPFRSGFLWEGVTSILIIWDPAGERGALQYNRPPLTIYK